MRLSNCEDLGSYLRECRREAGLSQADLAARATVSRRWLSDLEAGKPTVEVGLVFKVISALGLFVDCRPAPEPEIGLDAFLDSLGREP
ncbi:helix-turn-helix transcriptional regulator [Actinoplanes subtropicus]|uniref:helix-turn-helix transcriptional regulator n=1 Tax=Actinoplanes subtropicus TaxID=543632 RepID=UPI0004C2DBF4|nr:helix-turn-helix transcriptional regulator [Actinoplanes subtropicus]